MTNKDLMNILEQLNPNDEISVKIKECITKQEVDITYDIGYERNDNGELVLIIDVEKDKFEKI